MKQQLEVSTTNSDLSKTGEPNTTVQVVKSPLHWFANPDGVHRLRDKYGTVRAYVRCRYAHDHFLEAFVWQLDWASETWGEAPTLPLAKDAAERAVKEMDAP